MKKIKLKGKFKIKKIGIIFLFMFFLIFLAYMASAATVTLRPNQDSTPLQWDVIGTTAHYDAVNDITPDDDTTYIRTGRQYYEDNFNMQDTSISGTVSKIDIYFDAWGGLPYLGAYPTIGINIYIDGSWKTEQTQLLSGSYVTRVKTFTGSWNANSLNNLIVKIRKISKEPPSSGLVKVTQIYAVATYCADECSSGSTRCVGNIKQTCGNYDADICLEWGGDENCGTDYCEAWRNNYCKNNDVYHNRTCHDVGCSGGACFDNLNLEEAIVEDCLYGCSEGVCLPEPCQLTLASINPQCLGGLSTDCEEGESILISGTYIGDCSSADFLQIDARSSDLLCVLEYSGQNMSGIYDSIIPSGGSINGEWIIPLIPAECQGKLISGTAAALWSGNPLSGTQIDVTGSVSGSFTFYTPCTDECSLGDSQCVGNIKQVCGNYDADICLEWGGDDDCSDCSCSCGDYGLSDESLFCSDTKNNDCDACLDSEEYECGGIETSCSDTTDNDCDGFIDCSDSDCVSDPLCLTCTDNDGDGYAIEGGACGDIDCDDDPLACGVDCNPGFVNEIFCDGYDNDCDTLIDEDFTPPLGDSCNVGIGVCENTGTFICNLDKTETECSVSELPPTETPESTCSEGLDEDCDGFVDCDDHSGFDCCSDPVCSSTPTCLTPPSGDIILYKDKEYQLTFEIDTFKFYLYDSETGGWGPESSYTVSNLTEWHHVIVRYDGFFYTLYVDGNKGNDISSGKDNSSSQLLLGTSSYFQGLVDNLKIYSEALSEDIIYDLFSQKLIYSTIPEENEARIYRLDGKAEQAGVAAIVRIGRLERVCDILSRVTYTKCG